MGSMLFIFLSENARHKTGEKEAEGDGIVEKRDSQVVKFQIHSQIDSYIKLLGLGLYG